MHQDLVGPVDEEGRERADRGEPVTLVETPGARIERRDAEEQVAGAPAVGALDVIEQRGADALAAEGRGAVAIDTMYGAPATPAGRTSTSPQRSPPVSAISSTSSGDEQAARQASKPRPRVIHGSEVDIRPAAHRASSPRGRPDQRRRRSRQSRCIIAAGT